MPSYGYITLETGDYLLQENADKLIATDDTRITTLTDEWKTKQAEKVRQVAGLLVVSSHCKTVGAKRTYEKELGGSPNFKLAQAFIPPKTMYLAGVQFMLRCPDGNTADIKVSICPDNAGEPDTATESKTISTPTNEGFAWKTCTFNSTVSVSASTVYWVTFELVPSTSDENFWFASDDIGSEQNSSTYVSGAWTADTTQCLLVRLVSNAELDNEVVIEDLLSFKIIKDRDVIAYTLSATLANTDNQYSTGQINSSLLEAGKRVKCYVGMQLNPVVYYLAFYGFTDDNPAGQGQCELKARCFMSRLIQDRKSSSALGGLSYETAIETVGTQSGQEDYDLRTTGKTTISPLVFSDMPVASIIDKIREATVDRCQFYNTNTLYTTQRAKALASPSSTPEYEITESTFIESIEVHQNNDRLCNRITVTNDENGETTSDGNTLDVLAYQSLASGSGTIGSSVSGTYWTCTFGSSPAIFIKWNDGGTDTSVNELTRFCGGTGTTGSMRFEISNQNYPTDSGTYSITVNGCPIGNAGSLTMLGESFDQNSFEQYGMYSDRYDNNVIASCADAKTLADAILDERSLPIQKIKANCRGIADLYPDDIVSFVDTRANLDNIAIVTLVEQNYANDPPQFSMYIEAEKMPYESIALDFILAEDSSYILQEDGTYKFHP